MQERGKARFVIARPDEPSAGGGGKPVQQRLIRPLHPVLLGVGQACPHGERGKLRAPGAGRQREEVVSQLVRGKGGLVLPGAGLRDRQLHPGPAGLEKDPRDLQAVHERSQRIVGVHRHGGPAAAVVMRGCSTSESDGRSIQRIS